MKRSEVSKKVAIAYSKIQNKINGEYYNNDQFGAIEKSVSFPGEQQVFIIHQRHHEVFAKRLLSLSDFLNENPDDDYTFDTQRKVSSFLNFWPNSSVHHPDSVI